MPPLPPRTGPADVQAGPEADPRADGRVATTDPADLPIDAPAGSATPEDRTDPAEAAVRERAEEHLSTLPAEPRPPALGPIELLRWAWRQLTSMRIALILLFLLALAAIPGSLIPQRTVDPVAVSRFAREHPELT